MSLKVYKSSAGSGKTFTLVLEYLVLVLKYPLYYRQILAVTFTNKAANEMKTRVIEALWLISDPNNNRYPKYNLLVNLLAKNDFGSEELVNQRASKVFNAILHRYSDFHIGTIDAFIHRLVRTFAHDLNLPATFETILESDDLAKDMSNELIQFIGHDDYVTALITEFLIENIGEENDWRIDKMLRDYIRELLNEEAFFQADETGLPGEDELSQVKSWISSRIHTFERTMQSEADKILTLLSGAGITAEDMPGKSRGIGSVLQKLSSGRFEDGLTGVAFTKALESDQPFMAAKASQNLRLAFATVEENVMPRWERIRELMLTEYDRYIILKLLKRNIYGFALQNKLKQISLQIIHDRQEVHISEFNKRIAALLQSSPVPFIYERLGERYKSFLLDEFQDTSILQWHNMLPLLENSLATGNDNLIVGDGKQSIYRFRSGEFQQFLKLPEIYQAGINDHLLRVQDLLKRNYLEYNLDTNYRSEKVVVEFNNNFFGFVSKHYIGESYRVVYQNQAQKVHQPSNENGLVQIEFLEPTEEMQARRIRMIERTYDLVIEQTNAGFSLRDIAILVSYKEDGNEIARFLASRGIQVVSSDSLLLNSSSSVRLVLSLMRFQQYPSDQINRLEALFHLQDLRPEVLTATAGHNWFESYNLLNQKEQQDFVNKFLPSWNSNFSLYDLAEFIIRSLQLDKSPDAYLQFLLDEIYRFVVQDQKSLEEFLSYWDENGDNKSVVVPEQTEAVRVMTVHKAKGLEFPVVILPFATRSFSTLTRKNLWLDLKQLEIPGIKSGFIKASKSLEQTRYGFQYSDEKEKSKLDKLNVLYVALTRAIGKLYVLTSLPTRNVPGYAALFKDFLLDIGLWEDSKTIYTFGNEFNGKKTESEYQKNEETATVEFISTNWSEKISIAAESMPGSAMLFNHAALDAGNFIHALLARIIHVADAAPVLQNAFLSGFLDKTQQEKMGRLIDSFAHHELLSNAFDPRWKIKTEAGILTKTSEIFRVDRYVEMTDQVFIIDYKTGREDGSHHQQVRRYVKEIEDLQTKSVKGYLLYLFDYEKWELIEVK